MKKLFYFMMAIVASSLATNVNAQCATTAEIPTENLILECRVNPSQTISLDLDGTFDSIDWYLNGQLVSTSPTFTYNKWTSGDLYAVVECSGSSVTSNTITINKVNISLDSPDFRICFGELVGLSVPEIPGYTYQWTGGGLNGVDLGNTASISTNFDGNIFCRITSPTGCTKFSKQRVIIRGNCPEFLLQTPEDPYFLCGGDIGFLVIDDFPSTPDSVEWYLNGNLIETVLGSSGLTYQVDRWSMGFYSAIIYQGFASQEVDEVSVNKFNISASSTTVCPDQGVVLTAPEFNSGTTYYEWFLGGLNVGELVLEGENENTLTTDYEGNVFVRVTHNGCSKFNDIRLLPGANCEGSDPVNKGVNEENEAFSKSNILSNNLELFEAKIYPNPTNGIFSIDLRGLNNESETIISIYDLNGKLVSQKEINKTSNFVAEFNETQLSKGLYIANIVNGQQKEVIKISIE